MYVQYHRILDDSTVFLSLAGLARGQPLQTAHRNQRIDQANNHTVDRSINAPRLLPRHGKVGRFCCCQGLQQYSKPTNSPRPIMSKSQDAKRTSQDCERKERSEKSKKRRKKAPTVDRFEVAGQKMKPATIECRYSGNAVFLSAERLVPV
jgi:hypothetical protein